MTVFEAIADPTRRDMLNRLCSHGPLSVNDLAEPLEMTRQGATRHIDALVEAGLVRVRWEGRRRLHELELQPLFGLHDWLAPFEAEWDRRLERLRRHLETQDERVTTPHEQEDE
jgi:DNA-binding transcriptional ArsR family regulator